MGLHIYIQGLPSPNPASELVTGDRNRLIQLADRGIALVGEESCEPNPTSIKVRVGQCWAVADKVLEVTGFTESHAEYLEWTPAQPQLLPG